MVFGKSWLIFSPFFCCSSFLISIFSFALAFAAVAALAALAAAASIFALALAGLAVLRGASLVGSVQKNAMFACFTSSALVMNTWRSVPIVAFVSQFASAF